MLQCVSLGCPSGILPPPHLWTAGWGRGEGDSIGPSIAVTRAGQQTGSASAGEIDAQRFTRAPPHLVGVRKTSTT